MKNIFKIIRADLRHIKTNVIALCVIIGLTVIPALYSWFNILSNWDPYGQASTSRIKVAVVSVDKGTSLEGTELNVGDNIIDALKTNNTIGWQFVASSDEAIEGVYSGEYYAALVVPENFSKNLISFLSDSMEHPQLKYYCNQKANAIAPKITDKAKTAVQQQVNQTFIDTIVSTIAGTGDSVIKDADKETGSLMDAVINRLTSARTTLSTYDVILNSMLAITDLTSSISSSSNSAAPQVYTQLQLQQQQLITLQALVNGNSAESLNEFSSGTGWPASKHSILSIGSFTCPYFVITIPSFILSPRQSLAAFAICHAAFPTATRITFPSNFLSLSVFLTASSGRTALIAASIILSATALNSLFIRFSFLTL